MAPRPLGAMPLRRCDLTRRARVSTIMRRLVWALGCACLVVSVSCGRAPERATLDAPYFFTHLVSEAATEFNEVQFRSFRKDGRLTETVTFGDVTERSESRLSLVPPLPSRIHYDVGVPESARLEFATGVVPLGRRTGPRRPVTFAVDVDGERVFEHTERRRFGIRWRKHSVDLSAWAGQSVTVSFDTRLHDTDDVDVRTFKSDPPDVLAAWGHPVLDGDARAARPDLVLISIDCLRADHVSAYGHDVPTTPTLDALAEDGILFENVASVSSWTLPTHMSMLTGVMPSEHGLDRSRKRLPSVPYLPEILAREGYETIGLVSGLYLTPKFGYEDGFDLYHTLIDEPAEVLTQAASELLFARPSRPRFLFLHFFDAHWPYLPGDDHVERVGGRPREVSSLLRKIINRRPPKSDAEVADAKTLYDGEVAYVDEHLGRFLDAMKREGRYDDSLIVVTADHGEGFYEHGFWQHGEVIYNEVTRIPLIVKLPKGWSSPPSRISERVSQLGIFPTFLEAVGHDSPFEHAGLLSIAARRERAPAVVMSEIVWEPTEARGPFVKLAATEGSLKYVAAFAGDLDDPSSSRV